MRILIIHTAFIGDIILSTPLIKKIRLNHPDAEITYLTTPSGADVLKNNPLLEEIIIYDKKKVDKGLRGIFNIIKKIRNRKFDIVYIPHRYIRSAIIGFIGGIKTRIGYKKSGGAFLLNKKIEYTKGIHEVERLLSLVDFNKNLDTSIELFPSNKEILNVDKIWLDEDISDKKVVVMAPGSRWFTKMWPTDFFNELMLKIENENVKIIIVGGNDEKELPMIKANNIINMIGKTSLLELYEIIKRSDIIVTNDSSPIHLASATKAFIIAIFGATVKELGFYPWSKNSIIVENNNIKCRPCGLHGGNTCPKGHFKCMKEIKPQIIAEIINTKLKRGEK